MGGSGSLTSPARADAAPAVDGGLAGGAAAQAEGSKPQISVDTGAAAPAPGQASTWYFPDLAIATNDPAALIRSVTIQFTSAITPGADAVLAESDTANGFERLAASKDGTAVVNNAAGATAAQWQAYLRKHTALKLADAGGAKSLRMTASYKTQDTIYDFNAENGHYYRTVEGVCTFDEALAAASATQYMGMQGYLLTVTSQQEQDYAYTMIGQDCWIGAVCADVYTEDVKRKYQAYYQESLGVGTGSLTTHGTSAAYYFWISGPEAGEGGLPVHVGEYKVESSADKVVCQVCHASLGVAITATLLLFMGN